MNGWTLRATTIIELLLGLVIVLGGAWIVGLGVSGTTIDLDSSQGLLVGIVGCYLLAFGMRAAIKRYPSTEEVIYLLVITILILYALLTAYLMMGRIYYSRSFLFSSLFINIAIMIYYEMRGLKRHRWSFALVPCGSIDELAQIRGVDIETLAVPEIDRKRIDGLVVDLHAQLPEEWREFVATCVIEGKQIYHTENILETFTGKVSLDYLSKNYLEDLQPHYVYAVLKRFTDICAVLIMTPLILPVLLIVVLLIKLESRGGVLYIQERVGQGGVIFRMYKLRSMYAAPQDAEAQFAQKNDPRITKLGKFIRKWRIDELPQMWNIIKGDMSFIGPRPEQLVFVNDFEKTIKFYKYRHLVKPGITGWAQVAHGYAADEEQTKQKLQFDFYYIKHMSIWLDLVIVIRTIRTVLTGFGSR